MTYDFAYETFRQIQDSPTTSPVIFELRGHFVDQAIRYARIRTDWQRADAGDRQDIDEARTRAHNALIDAANILSRAMSKEELDCSWRQRLGNDRRTIGDFACFLHCFLGLAAR